jgi:hypothetical protein
MVLMKSTEINKNNSFSEFQRYIRGEMTKGEENSFRVKLQDFHYAQAITEGCFSDFSMRKGAFEKHTRDSSSDRGDIRSGKRIFVYSITALAALLMISYAGYVILNSNIPAWLQSSKVFTPGSPEARGMSPVSGQFQAGSVYVTDSIEIEKDLSILPADTIGSALTEIPAPGGDTGGMFLTGLRDSDMVNTGDRISANFTGTEVQTDIKPDPAPPAELSDTLLKSGNEPSVHKDPQPVDGTVSFRNYINANIKIPDSQSTGSGDEAVAVVSFLVRADGIIDSIKVISSPGEAYALEATRLIKEGPAWRPAETDGRATDEEVRLRIVFR